jgi:hypothetical protein
MDPMSSFINKLKLLINKEVLAFEKWGDLISGALRKDKCQLPTR